MRNEKGKEKFCEKPRFRRLLRQKKAAFTYSVKILMEMNFIMLSQFGYQTKIFGLQFLDRISSLSSLWKCGFQIHQCTFWTGDFWRNNHPNYFSEVEFCPKLDSNRQVDTTRSKPILTKTNYIKWWWPLSKQYTVYKN